MSKKKILIVDDEKQIAKVLDVKLRAAGFETILVYDGVAAISTLEQSPLDLIILDLGLPNKDGFYVLAELRKLKISVPVIVSSNSSQNEDIKRAKKLGARDYFIKAETTLVEVVEKVNQALRFDKT